MKILIVDDNTDNRRAIELLLEEFEGLEVYEAAGGQEAIERCRQEHFEIVFMDIMMPGVDGIMATKAIKSFDKKTMVIALSVLDDEASKKQMLANGAEDYMTKPIEDTLFRQRVKNYIEIVALRSLSPQSADVVNPFCREVYSRSLRFNIHSEKALAEFWDFYLNDLSYDIDGLEECVRVIYGFGQFCLKRDYPFLVIAEENETHLFLTLSPLNIINDLVIQHTLLKHYKNAVYIFDNHHLCFRLSKARSPERKEIEKLELSDYTQQILEKTHFKKIPAVDYVRDTPILLIDKIEDLENIRERIEAKTVEFEKNPLKEILIEISDLLQRYIEVIDKLVEFEHFAYALNTLNTFLQTLDPSQMESPDVKKFSLLLLSLLDDIESWRRNIFITQEANDIHYLDSSFLSTCLQIQSIFMNKEVSQKIEDDFELF